MTRKQRRLVLIGGSLGVLALAAVLVLSALKDSIVFFNSPTDVVEKHVAPGTRIRLVDVSSTMSTLSCARMDMRYSLPGLFEGHENIRGDVLQ